ncbi:MAG: peptidoglycan-binding protein [Rhodomicrobium sp.]|nr:peptidoglycan-binding protein [Rhodomicrobium sp.]
MTPLRARFTLFAVMALFLATAGNALFLQDRSRSLRMNGLPSTSVSITQFPTEKPPVTAAVTPAVPVRAVSIPAGKEPHGPRLYAALQRELAQRGYAGQLQSAGNGLRAAVLAYEFDNGMPLTGEPADALLKQVLFNVNQAPKGVFADRAEANPRFVMEIQKTLLSLGFFRGTLSGRLDIWTASAVKDFERHRHIPLTGRLTEATLLELIIYLGQPLQLSSG